MSDDQKVGPPDEAAGEGAAAKPAATEAAPRRAGKWRRRMWRLAVIVVLAALAFRLALSLLLPAVVHRAAHAFGLDLSYGRLDLNLLGTQAAIWDVTLRPRDGGDALVHADYAFANISSLQLFKLKLRAYRLEVDGTQVAVVRKPDGTIPLLQELA